jgi:hypothetical protein
LAENWQAQKIGGELIFSADLCYNGGSPKFSPFGKGGGTADGGMGFAQSLYDKTARLIRI